MAKKTKTKKEKSFVRPTGARMHKKNKGGRPLKMTPETREQIINFIMMGSYVETAAAAAGVDKETFYQWLRDGAEDRRQGKVNTAKAQFSVAVAQALGKSEQRDLLTIDNAAKNDWRAAAWKMERRAPTRWGPKAAMKIEEPGKEGFSGEENIHAEIAKLVSSHEGKE